MSAPGRILEFGRPAQRGEMGQRIRARACRTALAADGVKRRALQQAAHPTFISGSSIPTKQHATDAAFRFVDAVKDAGGTAASVLALANGLKEYAIARVGAVARSVARLRVELTRTWAEATVADAEAMADGRMTPREAARLADEFREVRDTLDEAILALSAVAQQDDPNGRPTPPEAA